MSAEIQPKMINIEDFSQLLQRYHRELLVYARTLTQEGHHSKDITQDAFVSAWQHIHVFDVTRDFAAWMRGIIRNKWREWLRKNKKVTAIDDAALEYFEAEVQCWESMKVGGGPALFIVLEDCLEKLPKALSDAVSSYYKDGLKTNAAADKLGVNGSTLRKRLERARTNLKECMQQSSQ